MSGVTLSAGIRSALLSAAGTAARTSAIQTRLATGRRANSALDNPQSFFTAQSLNARASQLNVLLDNVVQTQQTVENRRPEHRRPDQARTERQVPRPAGASRPSPRRPATTRIDRDRLGQPRRRIRGRRHRQCRHFGRRDSPPTWTDCRSRSGLPTYTVNSPAAENIGSDRLPHQQHRGPRRLRRGHGLASTAAANFSTLTANSTDVASSCEYRRPQPRSASPA